MESVIIPFYHFDGRHNDFSLKILCAEYILAHQFPTGLWVLSGRTPLLPLPCLLNEPLNHLLIQLCHTNLYSDIYTNMSLYGPATAPQRKRHLLNLQFAIVYFGATCLEWRVASGEWREETG